MDPAAASAKTAKIKKECERAAARLGAKGVVMIALYQDGEFVHALDAGLCPMPIKELYQMMLACHDKVDAGMEGFVQ